MANIIDRAIGYINPKAGAARAFHRKRIEILNEARSYEGASSGRIAANWFATSSTADAEISKAGTTLRQRSRDLVRNNPLAAKIISTHANNIVGPGIMPRAKTGDEKLNARIDELFKEWSGHCVVDSSIDFGGLCYLLARMMVQDGELYVRRRHRKIKDGYAVPLQLQVLDSEFCDWNKSGELQSNPGNIIVNGIEFDAIGRRRGYWLFQTHPSTPLAFLRGGASSNFVDADSVVHLYEPQSNQVHGVPWLAPVMIELRNLSDYELAENIRKKIEACAVGMIIPNETDPTDPNIGLGFPEDTKTRGAAVRDIYGNPFERMEPGMFGVLEGGKDIRFNNPAMSVGVEAYIRTRQRSIASGARIPYELMTGDYSQSNFASGKMGLNDYRRFIQSIQRHYFIPMALTKIWGWFVEAGKLSGKIPMNVKVSCEWTPPEFESVTPLDDSKADLNDIRMGKRSPQEIIAKTGRNPDTVLSEIIEWNAKLDQNKVILDSDPRATSLSGQIQSVREEQQSAGKKPDQRRP